MRVLIVDDHAHYLGLVSSWLSMLGGIVAVEVANSGAEALAMLERVQPDLVLTDLQMPEMNGAELTRALKALAEAPAVVIMTGLATTHARSEAQAAGADYFVEKSRLHHLLPEFLREHFGLGHVRQ